MSVMCVQVSQKTPGFKMQGIFLDAPWNGDLGNPLLEKHDKTQLA
jgi:hypothetical protein